MPRYGSINERRNQLHEVIRLSGMNLIIDETDHPLIIKVASIQSARMQVYFIDNEDYFQKKMETTDDLGIDCKDNDERSIFFIRGVLETVKKLRWVPDVVHCHGWMTALAPLYIKKGYRDTPSFKNAKVVFSAYPEPYTHPFAQAFAQKLLIDGVQPSDVSSLSSGVNFTSLQKLAIDYSDGVIWETDQVNPELAAYAAEKGAITQSIASKEQYTASCIEMYDKIFG